MLENDRSSSDEIVSLPWAQSWEAKTENTIGQKFPFIYR